MDRKEIIGSLIEKHAQFAEYLKALSKKDFEYSPENKWSAGQQLDHICKSVDPLVKVLMLPKFVLKLWFGKSNRPSKNYDKLVEKYQSKLSEGGKAFGRFIPEIIEYPQKERLIQKLNQLIVSLEKRVNKFSEQELDTLILPHPLLGKLTLREMLYFTIYHVQHHHRLAINSLSSAHI